MVVSGTLGRCRLERRRGSAGSVGGRTSPRRRLRRVAGAAGVEGESGAAEVLTYESKQAEI
jgi:hypothetical protein